VVSGGKTALIKNIFREDIIRGSTHIIYHAALVALSAGLALSLPVAISFFDRKVLTYWFTIRNNELFTISIEMAIAMLLIFFFNYVSRNWKNKKLSKNAKAAGLVLTTMTKGFFAKRRIRKLKEKQGSARDIMIIGSTGFRTFVDPKGEMYQVVQNCREAKIMLLNPYSEGASARAKSILNPGVTPEQFREQIKKTFHFLKGLKAVQKNIRLKLYSDMPLLKLSILGDYIWVQHYHSGLDIQRMPKYVFKHDQDHESLYEPFYQYFLARWGNPDIPEYDLNTDELIYRDMPGNEVKRERFEKAETEGILSPLPSYPLVLKNDTPPGKTVYPLMQANRNHPCTEGFFRNVW
jgi:hypothetical protein